MKNHLKLSFAALVLLLGGSAAAAQDARPITCVFGEPMKVTLTATEAGPRLSLRFRRAPVGAADALPGPGECAWRDRPLTPPEPRVLRVDEADRLFPELRVAAADATVTDDAVPRPGAASRSAAAFFLRTLESEGCFTAQATVTDRGHLAVRGLAPGC